jgi:hypothetical protein
MNTQNSTWQPAGSSPAECLMSADSELNSEKMNLFETIGKFSSGGGGGRRPLSS